MAEHRWKLLFVATMHVGLTVAGCGRTTPPLPQKAARPVTVLTLTKNAPSASNVVSGVVKSWKTEQIGFEVAGRVEWVLEPGNDIERRIAGAEGEWFNEGTALAKIDPARFEVALESANALYDVAVLNKESIEIRLSDALPAELKSARADLELAETDSKRIEKLNRQNAASESELDQAVNLVQTSKARVASLEATEKQTRAELKAALAQIKSAQQAVRDATRDLEHTTLYASYRGQISDVHVVPGSVVSPGSPVVTLQMMDPIKIEVEVSADKSRELRQRQQLPVSFKLPDGSTKQGHAIIYNIDTSADTTSRTFTLELMLLNDKFLAPIPEGADAENVARAGDVWPLRVNRIVGAPDDVSVVEEKSIVANEGGHYVYQVTNAQFGETFPELLSVKRQPLTLQKLRIPFLGIWTFQAVSFSNPSEMHDQTMIVGSLKVGTDLVADWRGDTVVLDSGARWIFRPGDLVDVSLSGEASDAGYYVPVNAIYEESGETSVFVVDGEVVRKLAVETVSSETLSGGPLIEVESAEIGDGMQIVVGGVHFLSDGDRVKPLANGQAKE